MPSIPGSPKPRVHLEEDISHHHKGNLPLWLATSTITKHRRIPSPPPLMPRNCNAPVIPQRIHRNSHQPITSVPLHRVPSPSSPLHILTPTTPPIQQVHTGFESSSSAFNQENASNRRMSLRFRKQKSEPPPEPLSKTPPAENRKYFFSWARSSKTSFQNPDPRTRRSVRALKTPSATFYYDKDEAPVKC
uniref:Uncharacterized protein n=1 Tax=Panagrolaimus sp. ES5 TaxID=591445 RepID=A0AC34GV73_9BILA